jgi:hypothetical protein
MVWCDPIDRFDAHRVPSAAAVRKGDSDRERERRRRQKPPKLKLEADTFEHRDQPDSDDESG